MTYVHLLSLENMRDNNTPQNSSTDATPKIDSFAVKTDTYTQDGHYENNIYAFVKHLLDCSTFEKYIAATTLEVTRPDEAYLL